MAIGAALSMFDNKIRPHFAHGAKIESVVLTHNHG